MGKFGAMITAEKSGGAFTKAECEELSAKLQSLIKEDDFVNADMKPFNHKFEIMSAQPFTSVVMLTQYDEEIDEEEDEENPLHELLVDEGMDAEMLASQLSEIFLPEKYTFAGFSDQL